MTQINCPTEVYEFVAETTAVLKSVLGGLGETMQVVGNACADALHITTRCEEVRDGVRNMIDTAKERLISVENLLLSEEEDTRRWQSEKEKLLAFVKSAEHAKEILDGAYAYLKQSMEETSALKDAFQTSAQSFGQECGYGLKKLYDVTFALKRYEALPKIGETI